MSMKTSRHFGHRDTINLMMPLHPYKHLHLLCAVENLYVPWLDFTLQMVQIFLVPGLVLVLLQLCDEVNFSGAGRQIL